MDGRQLLQLVTEMRRAIATGDESQRRSWQDHRALHAAHKALSECLDAVEDEVRVPKLFPLIPIQSLHMLDQPTMNSLQSLNKSAGIHSHIAESVESWVEAVSQSMTMVRRK